MRTFSLDLTGNSSILRSELASVETVLVERAASRKGLDGSTTTSIVVLFASSAIPKIIGLIRDYVNKGNSVTIESCGFRVKVDNVLDMRVWDRVQQVLEAAKQDRTD
jgi:hypothetical protein